MNSLGILLSIAFGSSSSQCLITSILRSLLILVYMFVMSNVARTVFFSTFFRRLLTKSTVSLM